MKHLIKRLFLPLISLCLLGTNTPVIADDYLFVKGIGENEKEAISDAREQLALQVYSQVEVAERNTQVKLNDVVESSYAFESSVKSLPVQIGLMQVINKECDNLGCEYQYKVNKTQWINALEHEVAANHVLIRDFLTVNDNQLWSSLLRIKHAQEKLQQTKMWLKVLGSLSGNTSSPLLSDQSELTQLSYELEKRIPVEIRSSADLLSVQAAETLSQLLEATGKGKLIVYIKSKQKQGHKNNKYMAKLALTFQVFEANNPGVVVGQKTLTEIGDSPQSVEHAIRHARQKLMIQIKNNSIYSLLHKG
ncbi:hypothetical protein C9I92_08770 [Photobacterium ganghwense]|uniref:LPP20 lipoprotein n=1 Tax=Photobacterium ganghwense TaxID=320778 RepID=A0A0J1HFY8_9GAMM|nr:hypothetical protein ABT57_08120 [Photobacterium ganghwense]PSU09603.1 hypothetical protein C9I92_08770 [Photobacterium ganghwense]